MSILFDKLDFLNYIIMDMKKGVSLVLVMGIFVILGIIVIAFITISSTQLKISHFTTYSTIAFHAAEAGLDYGIARIPVNLEAFPESGMWDTLPNNAQYKSGFPDAPPAPIEKCGQSYLVGYSIEKGAGTDFYDFKYELSASGKLHRSERVIKAMIKCGPLAGGTYY